MRIYSFTLILSVDYLLKVAEFFTDTATPPETVPAATSATTLKTTDSKTQSQKANVETEENPVQMTVNLKVEMPDIVLVEHMDNIDTNAMILNVSIKKLFLIWSIG